MATKGFLTQDSKSEFIGQIVDIFEDYLDENEITLANEDREDAIAKGDVEPEEAAIIYGAQYDIIGNIVSDAVEIYDLTNKGFSSKDTEQTVVDKIMDAFYELLDEGEYTEAIPTADSMFLRDSVHDTFVHWGLI